MSRQFTCISILLKVDLLCRKTLMRRCSYLKGPTQHFWKLIEEFPSGAENIKELEWFYFPWVNSSLFSLLKLTSFHTENTRKSFFQSANKACPSAIFIAFVSLIRTPKPEQNTQPWFIYSQWLKVSIFIASQAYIKKGIHQFRFFLSSMRNPDYLVNHYKCCEDFPLISCV